MHVPPGTRTVEETGNPFAAPAVVMPGVKGTAARAATEAVNRTAALSPADLLAKPSLDHLRRQARDLLRAARAGETTGAGRIRAPSTASTRSPSSSGTTTCRPDSTARPTRYSPASITATTVPHSP